MAQTVFVLGAGAAYGDSLHLVDEAKWRQICRANPDKLLNPPLIDQFFDEKHMWWSTPESIKKVMPELVTYIKNRWGLKGDFGTETWKRVNLEDVFTSAAIEEEFNPVGTRKNARSQLLLHQIRRYVSFVLGRSTIYRYGDFSRALVRWLQESDTIITFNYDLLIDQELFSTEGPYQYHNFADCILDQPLRHWPPAYRTLRDKNTGGGLYLKLHGSLNWSICTNAACPRSKRIDILDTEHCLLLYHSPTGAPSPCDACKSELSTLLVPPLLNKPVLHAPIFRMIWGNALHELQQAQRIVIIGYSFPLTDFYAEWLFRAASIDQETPVWVVNPLNDPEHPDQNAHREFARRMRSLFIHGYNSEYLRFDQIGTLLEGIFQ